MDVTEDEDWLGEAMHAAINRELDRIERRNGPDFTPTFERDLAFNVAALALQAFSARGNTIGGTMLAKELQDKLGFSAALTTAQSEAAELRNEVERLREGLGNISNGSCVEDWGHKPEKDFQDYADAVLANSDECLVVCPSCDGARYDVWGGVPDRDCTVCWGRGKITRAALKEPQHEG